VDNRKDLYVRIVFNGIPLKFEDCLNGGTLCSISKSKKIFDRYLILDDDKLLKKLCHQTPKFI
jgi:hypothetical protein